MKKILKLSLIILLIILLAFVITGCGKDENTNQSQEDNGKSKTYNLFTKVFSGENYIVSLEGETDMGEGIEKMTATMAIKGDNLYADVDSTSQHASIICKDNKTYIIMHDEKMYMIMDGKDEETFEEMTLISTEDLKEMENKEYKTGKETIDGTEYEYEEYENEEDKTTERYYFLGNDLKYIKSIDGDRKEEIMRVIKISSEVDDNIFNIPEDYQGINTSDLQ